MNELKINGVYRHFKGMEVTVIAEAKHSETLEPLVIYTHDNEVWARPKKLFLSEVDHEKYPNIKQKYRFELIDVSKKHNK